MISLSTERLTLEAISLDDAAAIRDGERGEDLWMEGYPTPGDLTVARFVLERQIPPESQAPFIPYTLRSKAEAMRIGGAGFHGPPSDRICEIGYELAPKAQGNGLATEAVGALIEVAAASGEVDLVIAWTDANNIASQAVLLRAGFAHRSERDLPDGHYFELRVT